jgi:hypothetical protein
VRDLKRVKGRLAEVNDEVEVFKQGLNNVKVYVSLTDIGVLVKLVWDDQRGYVESITTGVPIESIANDLSKKKLEDKIKEFREQKAKYTAQLSIAEARYEQGDYDYEWS